MLPPKRTLMHRPQDSGLANGVLLYDGSGRFFDDGLEKRASEDIVKEANITPKPGNAYVHLVSVAAGDIFGHNSNNDYYNEGPTSWTFPLAKGGPRTRTLGGGLLEHHASYRKYGGVYREHQNSKKGFEKLGSIAYDRYNKDGHYGELIVELPLDKWAGTIQKLASGKPVFWSQGSSIRADICSLCGNERTNAATTCEHISKYAGRMTPEGYTAFMINDIPVFHDISEVAVPAEKIAFALQKVASGSANDIHDIVFPNIPVSFGVVQSLCGVSGADRYTLLQKLAAEEKDVKENKTEADKALESAVQSDEETEDKIVKKVKHLDMPDLQGNLIRKKCMLTPRGFACILVSKAGSNPDDPSAASAIEGMLGKTPTMFSDLLSSDRMGEILDDGSYVANCCPSCGKALVDELTPDLSLEPDKVADRAVKSAVSGKSKSKGKMEKKASNDPGIEKLAQLLTTEYAKYQLTTLAALNPSPFLTRATVLMNRRMAP